MYVSFFDCPYQEVLPASMTDYLTLSQQAAAQAQKQSVGLGCLGNSGCGCGCSGMGDYVSPFPFPVPQHLSAGNSRGLGDLALTAPDGYFSSGADVTQWGIAEWATAVVGAYMVFSTVFTTRRATRSFGERRKRAASRSKSLKAAAAKRGFF